MLVAMLSELLQKWRRPRIGTADALAKFLERNAWMVSQKNVIGYCTVKTNLPMSELLREKPFADAYDIAIWEAYAAVLADLVAVAETYLRSHAERRAPEVAAALGATYEALLVAHPLPPHRSAGWGREVAAVRRRLGESLATVPKSIRHISATSADRIVATLPIHERLRAPDAPAVVAGVQFMMVGLAHEFESRLDGAAIVADMLAAREAE